MYERKETKKSLCIIAMLCAVVMLLWMPICAEASAGDYGYTVKTDGTIAISSYAGNDTEIVIPAEIDGRKVTSIANNAFSNRSALTSVKIPAGVTGIGEYAFYYCTSLVSVALPEDLKSIGKNAFFGCKKLKSVEIPAGVTSVEEHVFGDCYALASVSLPEDLKSIGRYAFSNCRKITEIKIPAGVTSIGEFAFYYCEKLTNLELPQGITTIEKGLFSNCEALVSMDLPDGITGIGDSAFSRCSSLKSIEITDSVKSIGSYAFEQCKNLQNVKLPAGITELKVKTFDSCYKLEEIELPDSITSIGDLVFASCSKLASIDLPEGLTSIGNQAFHLCSSLKSIKLPKGITALSASAFGGCTSLESIELPKNLKSIGARAFALCSSLTSIELPKGVTSIGAGCFTKCKNLTEVILPKGITQIEAETFFNCGSLVNIEIPYGVISIGERAFASCSGLDKIVLPDSVKVIEASAFWLSDGMGKIVIPAGITDIGEGAIETDTTIYGRSGTMAETYAMGNGNKFISTSEVKCNHSYVASASNDGMEKTTYLCSQCGYSYYLYNLYQPVEGEYNQGNYYDIAGYADMVLKGAMAAIPGGFLRVDVPRESEIPYIVVEEYNNQLQFVQGRGIPMELPLYGGFFAGEDGYYFVFGQANFAERYDVEVLRIVKYSKSWERLGSDSLYGANTSEPFDAGSLRMCESDGELYIKTCHAMYADTAGVNHQANMVVRFDETYMKVVKAYYEVEDYKYGYASHSFNQFIVDGKNGIATIDHGDASPRSIVLSEARTGEQMTVLSIPSTVEKHYNNTFTTVGGFEASDSHYLVAGSAVHYDENYENNKTCNIYLATVPLDNVDSSNVNVSWLTNYVEGAEYSVENPQLVELDKNNYVLLWELSKKGTGVNYILNTKEIYVAFLDGSGNLRGNVRKINGFLSDCKPIYENGEILWFANQKEINEEGKSFNNTVFYRYRVSWENGQAVGLVGSNSADTGSTLNGVLCVNGVWAYYENGAINTAYTGLVQNETGWWYIENGYVNFNYNGLIPFGDAWWCVANGAVVFDYTGLWCDPIVGWWYVENGIINFNYNGLIPFGEAWWCVAGGAVIFDYTGLWCDPIVGWWYVENGIINFNYNGLIPFGEAWWCVAGGAVIFDYTGLWNDPVVGWWYVENGVINFNYNGFVASADTWWCVAGGRVAFDYTGEWSDPSVGRWYVENGTINFAYGKLGE